MISLESQKNVYSQYGEDGLIEQICLNLNIQNGYFCEFGAWDGKYLSNCRALYEKGWSGIFIEGDGRKFLDLKRNYESDVKITCVNKFVSPTGDASLEEIFKRNKVGKIDLLSIDIDGDDLLIWKSLKSLRPKIVLIEYNPIIPFDTYFENPCGENKGNSALSIVDFAKISNYVLVAGNGVNLIFIDKNHIVASTPEMSLLSLREFIPSPRYFFGYDGSLIVNRGEASSVEEIFYVPWTAALATQPLPANLRGYARHSPARYIASRLSAFVRRPLSSIRWMLT